MEKASSGPGRLWAAIAVLAALAIAGAAFAALHVPDAQAPTESGFPAGLEAQVTAAVEKETEGKWDKKLALGRIDETQKAAEGKWYAGDAWDWIAWQDAGSWKVLVSLDGFDCVGLQAVPAEYADFFRDAVHAQSGEPYCYPHD